MLAATLGEPALAAHYGTLPPTAPTSSPTLSVSDHRPLCASAKGTCVETTGAVHAYPVSSGDRITLRWSNDPNQIDGVIHIGNLYLPMATDAEASVSPVTLEMHFPTSDGGATVAVEYAGTRHHVPLTPGEWQPISIYDPDERIMYVRFELPGPKPPN